MNKWIRLGEDGIYFTDGWFVYSDGKGNYSIISRECAHKEVSGYHAYMASQDVERGGVAPQIAYPGHGFKEINGKYVYMGSEVDTLPDGPIKPIEGTLIIPKRVGDFEINYVKKHAFQGISELYKVILHEDINSIEARAFADCENLCSVQGLSTECTVLKEAFTNTKVFDSGKDQYLDSILVKAHLSHIGKFIVKDGTTCIAGSAFEDCYRISEVIIPESVHTIENNAFKNCTALKRITLPQTLKKLGSYVFKNCIILNHVAVPAGTDALKFGLFEGCKNLVDVHIPDTIKEIASDAFNDTGIMNQFLASNQKSLYIDNWLICFKDETPIDLKVTYGTIGVADMKIYYGRNRFLHSLHLPDTLQYIGSDAFKVSGLSQVKLPNSLKRIGSSAFQNTDIKELSIPASVERIEQWAFMRCNNLQRIIFEGRNTQVIWPAITERKDKGTITIVAPSGSHAEDYYKQYKEKYHLSFEELKY